MSIRMSIRLRLTLLYSAILALTLIAFGSALYFAQSQSTYESIRSNLAGQVDGMAEGKGRFPGGGRIPLDRVPNTGTGGATSAGGSGSFVALPGRWTQIRSADGITVTARSPDLGDVSLPLSQKGLQAVAGGAGWYETAQVEDQPLLIYSKLAHPATGATEIVQVAYPIGLPQQQLTTLRIILVSGSSLIILAAFAMGWLLAGTALRPIERITHTAAAIGAEHDFSRRVDHTGPPDEVGQLAFTFNNMLAELESAYRQLEGALDSQRRFVADASHELRTPLTTVRGNIELLRRQVPQMPPGDRAEILSDTTEEVERLIRLVNQLLVLARADNGQALRREPFAVRPLVEDVYRQAKMLAPQSTIACDDLVDAQVQGDRDALKQVLLILIDNAVVHTPPGTSIELAAAAGDGQVAIAVRDSGPGIPAEALSHIFERFYRGEISRSGGGAGLGLSIARELVEAQGGTLTVYSDMEKGSTFTVTLPAA